MPAVDERKWKKVSFAADCGGDDCCACSVCGVDYDICECPGPTQDGFEYEARDGVMFARRTDAPE